MSYINIIHVCMLFIAQVCMKRDLFQLHNAVKAHLLLQIKKAA